MPADAQLQLCPADDAPYQLWQDGEVRCSECAASAGSLGPRRPDRRWMYRQRPGARAGRLVQPGASQ